MSSFYLFLLVWLLTAPTPSIGFIHCPVKSLEEVCVPDSKYLKIYLFTNENPTDPYIISFDNIEEAPFLPLAQTKIIIHGATGHENEELNTAVRPAYFKRDKYNLISINYQPLTTTNILCYFQAAQNAEVVGKCLALLLEKIFRIRKTLLKNLHVIGWSLGGQVAGQIGKNLKSFNITRITGLDPSSFAYDEVFNSAKSLSEHDAIIVDVIHTNSLIGKLKPIGTVDWYIEGGTGQPGCSVGDLSCEHFRAVEIFAESIESEVQKSVFYGYKCDSLAEIMLNQCKHPEPDSKDWALVGEDMNPGTTGIYYVRTNSKSPYAKGKN